ncbi:MAG: hypothetical protein ABL971_13775 [Vicinamibacterales bacterium]
MILERRYNLFGYRATFRTNHARAEALLSGLYVGKADGNERGPLNLYELLHRPEAPVGEQWAIAVPGLAAHSKPTLGEAMFGIEASMAGDVARYDHGLFIVHGAVVYTPQGALLLSGFSGSGKTTLSLALAARGFALGGDDMALLDPSTGLIEPHPRCFHIDPPTDRLVEELGLHLPADALRDRFVTPWDLGVASLPPARVRAVFLLESERVAAPRIVPESQAEAASALLLQVGRGRFSDVEAVRHVAAMTGSARCFRVWSGELGASVDAVLAAAGS